MTGETPVPPTSVSPSHALLEYQSILTAVKNLPDRLEEDPERLIERQREKEIIKRRLATLTDESPAVHAFVERNVTRFNGTPGDPYSFDLLDDLLNHQPYRLCFCARGLRRDQLSPLLRHQRPGGPEHGAA